MLVDRWHGLFVALLTSLNSTPSGTGKNWASSDSSANESDNKLNLRHITSEQKTFYIEDKFVEMFWSLLTTSHLSAKYAKQVLAIGFETFLNKNSF